MPPASSPRTGSRPRGAHLPDSDWDSSPSEEPPPPPALAPDARASAKDGTKHTANPRLCTTVEVVGEEPTKGNPWPWIVAVPFACVGLVLILGPIASLLPRRRK